jgi:exopolysaccharide production protein ExoY
MTNGTSALATQRRERPTSGQTWRTISTSGTSTRGRSEDDGFRGDAPNIVWLGERATVVGGGTKRWFDVMGAVAAIILLLPLFCLIALAIKLWDRGPIFYRHRRIGLNGADFDCLKFRTMVVNSDDVLTRHLATNGEAAREWEETRKLKRDPRITPLGSSMRKTSIDELPQLVNILKGEMSFVGPRPIVTAEVPKYGGSDRPVASQWPQRRRLRDTGRARSPLHRRMELLARLGDHRQNRPGRRHRARLLLSGPRQEPGGERIGKARSSGRDQRRRGRTRRSGRHRARLGTVAS